MTGSRRPPTKADRDANLDALQAAVDEWGEKERNRLENEVKFMRAVLKGRTGSEEAGTEALDAASTGYTVTHGTFESAIHSQNNTVP
jgi:hypothetical protein